MSGPEQEFVNPNYDRVRPKGINIGRAWERRAVENEQEWGIQHPEELLSAINEEVGEIEQAYLEATHENGDPVNVEGEIDDLGPLLLQLVESVRRHPLAFDALPTLQEVESDE
jgi:NTP pyrophosphatase (non-canonical NTP hydrolase)